MIKVSIFGFMTLAKAVEHFEKMGYPADKVTIEGFYGGIYPTEDDSPVFVVDDSDSRVAQ